MAADSLLRGAARAFSGPPLALTAVTTLAVAIGGAAGMFGVPLLLIGAAWTWTYAFLLVEATAHGLPPPVLAIEDTNPWREPRPLLQLVALGATASLVWWLGQQFGTVLAAAVGVATLLALPASVALLAIDGDPWRAASPPALVRVAVGIGARYFGILALGAGYAALLVVLAPRLPSIVLLIAAQLLIYSLATALGAALHARRHQLGLDAVRAPERDAAREARSAENLRAAMAEELYGLMRARHPEVAWARASAWLERDGREPATYRWLRDRALMWGETRFADRLVEDLVARLIALGRRGEALEEVEACWRRGGRYAPADSRDRDALESVARALGRAAALERLRAERAAAR
jgi:hypothetical protein